MNNLQKRQKIKDIISLKNHIFQRREITLTKEKKLWTNLPVNLKVLSKYEQIKQLQESKIINGIPRMEDIPKS